jgi:hypothetical protein
VKKQIERRSRSSGIITTTEGTQILRFISREKYNSIFTITLVRGREWKKQKLDIGQLGSYEAIRGVINQYLVSSITLGSLFMACQEV